MSSSMGIRVRAPLVAVAAACWTLTLWAQAGAPPPAPGASAAAAAAQRERIEQAHEDVRRVTESTARDAARLSHEVAGAIDADASGRPAPRQTFIDRLVFDRIERDGIPHAGLASDEEFVRRVYLDAIGLPPSPAEVRAFLADSAPDKRDRLIDALLARDEFAEQWAWYWGDLLRMSDESGPGSQAFHYWCKEQLRVDRPYDRFVHDVLTPSSKVHATLPSLAMIGRSNQLKSRMVESADDYRISNRLDHIDALTIDISRVFLGLNTSCISCHDGARHLEEVNTYLADAHAQGVLRAGGVLRQDADDRQLERPVKNVDRDLQVDDLWPRATTPATMRRSCTLAESPVPAPEGRVRAGVPADRREARARGRSARRAGAHDHVASAVRPRDGQPDLGPADDGRVRRAVRRVRPQPAVRPGRAADQPRAARGDGRGLPRERLPPEAR